MGSKAGTRTHHLAVDQHQDQALLFTGCLMTKRFVCPGCKTKLRIPDRVADKVTRCPKCKRSFSEDSDTPEPAATPEPTATNTFSVLAVIGKLDTFSLRGLIGKLSVILVPLLGIVILGLPIWLGLWIGFAMVSVSKPPPANVLADAAAENKKKPDAIRFKDRWLGVSAEKEGRAIAQAGDPCTLSVGDGKLAFSVAGDEWFRGDFNLDPQTRPKEITLTLIEGRPKDAKVALSKGYKGKQRLGIYALEGDELKLCLAADGQPRPKSFSTRVGDGLTLAVFRHQSNWELEGKSVQDMKGSGFWLSLLAILAISGVIGATLGRGLGIFVSAFLGYGDSYTERWEYTPPTKRCITTIHDHAKYARHQETMAATGFCVFIFLAVMGLTAWLVLYFS